MIRIGREIQCLPYQRKSYQPFRSCLPCLNINHVSYISHVSQVSHFSKVNHVSRFSQSVICFISAMSAMSGKQVMSVMSSMSSISAISYLISPSVSHVSHFIANLQISHDLPVQQKKSGWLYSWVVGCLAVCMQRLKMFRLADLQLNVPLLFTPLLPSSTINF